jgi:hypothetical protein
MKCPLKQSNSPVNFASLVLLKISTANPSRAEVIGIIFYM